MIEINQGAIRLWVPDVAEIEAQAVDQLKNIANLPILAGPLAVMPDVHLGKGATVGSVVPTHRAIIPAAVGVDIGCGMAAVQTNLVASDLPLDLGNLRSRLESVLPVGFKGHEDEYRFKDAALEARRQELADTLDDLSISADRGKTGKQIGTMGGGNHFLEICLDQEQRVWVMLHSGSRNLGKTIAEFHITKAKELLANKGVRIPDTDLAWLAEDTDLAAYTAYLHDLDLAQRYARLNREAMLEIVWNELAAIFQVRGKAIKQEAAVINCHHNYVEFDYRPGVHVTRKGAVSARKGEMGIIPGSMGTKSYIVRGKGNEDSYCSCSHGAGRRMSRNAAAGRRDFKTGEIKSPGAFTVADLVKATEGVECRKDEGVLDEIPGAYKDIDQVIANQADLIETVHTLKQVLCVKG